MKILFDQGTPAPLRGALPAHEVTTAYEMGWGELENGALLDAVTGAFDVFITTDQSLPFQQNLKGRTFAILVLPTTSWPRLQSHLGQIAAAVEELRPGLTLALQFHD